MKRITTVELGGLILAAALIGVGFTWMIQPGDHFYIYAPEALANFAASAVEVTSRSGTQVHGVLAMAIGIGVAAFSVYRSEK